MWQLLQQSRSTPISLHLCFDEEVPFDLKELVLKCTQEDPSYRPQKMSDVLERLQGIRKAMGPNPVGLYLKQQRRSNSAPEHLPSLANVDQLSALLQSQYVKADGVMRQFFVRNTGPLPIKLMIYDCDDVMRVSEMLAPSSQYPFEQNTCVPQFSAAMLAYRRVLSCRYLPLPSRQRVRVVLQVA